MSARGGVDAAGVMLVWCACTMACSIRQARVMSRHLCQEYLSGHCLCGGAHGAGMLAASGCVMQVERCDVI